MSPIEIVLGRQPVTPLDVAKIKNQGKCPAAYRVARDKLEMISEAQVSLRNAQRCMKKYVYQHRRSLEFNLLKRLKIHTTFHARFLKPYSTDADDPGKNRSKRAPLSIPTQFDAEIERILDHRVLGRSKKNIKTEFLIHWKGKRVVMSSRFGFIWGFVYIDLMSSNA
ncbi:hypothetical protein KY290_012885 [Solanum tuberosum]|uniref:Chromo domain-containing protein n=1 Tax=Solanum tuberosum TaxID=4113 RepID=A0ABQ7VK80_SOLTU|nr:hypothetical protein KY285_012636 [Solanum tuberosum]KAH0768904.1 hypothetical protein KY290_012885 [Solanum tuberosum]